VCLQVGHAHVERHIVSIKRRVLEVEEVVPLRLKVVDDAEELAQQVVHALQPVITHAATQSLAEGGATQSLHGHTHLWAASDLNWWIVLNMSSSFTMRRQNASKRPKICGKRADGKTSQRAAHHASTTQRRSHHSHLRLREVELLALWN
jgi:hypothetical protein